MDFKQQVAGIVSKDKMRRFVDELEEGDHAMLLVWRSDGAKRFAQLGMGLIAEVTHFLGCFWQDFVSGSWPTNDGED